MTASRIQWGKGRKQEFIDWIHAEIRRVQAQRSSLEQKWRDWLELYRAPYQKYSEKAFPYEGAADFPYPFAMMQVNPILANELQSLHATENLWTLGPLNERWVSAAKPLQDYLQFVDRRFINMWDTNYRVGLEKLKLGTGIYKTAWEYRQNRTTGYDENLQRARILSTINRPFSRHVHLANFYIPPEALEIDPDATMGAQWVAERLRMRPATLLAQSKGQEPFLPNFDKAAVDNIMEQREFMLTDDEQKKRELDRLGDSFSVNEQIVELFEVHARFDTTGDGIEDDVVVKIHLNINEIVQALHNPFAHGKRPYDAVRFLRGDGFYGIGLCEISESWQAIIEEMLNNSIDKARLSNAPMLAFKEGANIVPGEPIYPTKMWALQNPKEDLVPLFLTDNRGNFDFSQIIEFAVSSGNQATGMSDLRRGNIGSLPSRTPATTVQSMLEESGMLLDLPMKDARKGGLSEVGLKTLQLIQQMTGNPQVNPGGQQYIDLAMMVLGEKGEFVAQALALPFEDISTGIGVELTATSAANNKVLEQQKLMGILQLAAQLGPVVVQLMQMAEQMPRSATAATAVGAAQGVIELFRRLLEQNDIRNINDILPEEGVEQILSAPQNPAGAQAAQQGMGGANPIAPPQGIS